jgi:hypothetical protein
MSELKNNSIVQVGIAAQLREMHLDRDGVIQYAAKLLADLSERLVEAQELATAADIRADAAKEQTSYYQKWADDGWQAVEQFLKFFDDHKKRVEELPALLDTLTKLAMKTQRRVQAFENAAKKLANDPTQKAKDEVANRWVDWHMEAPHLYSTNDEFATDILKIYPKLNNHTQITQWCGEWSKTVVLNCWKILKCTLASPMAKAEFANAMIHRIKTLRKHTIIGWCDKWEAPSNPAS